jgi:GTPase SAR1 family protein
MSEPREPRAERPPSRDEHQFLPSSYGSGDDEPGEAAEELDAEHQDDDADQETGSAPRLVYDERDAPPSGFGLGSFPGATPNPSAGAGTNGYARNARPGNAYPSAEASAYSAEREASQPSSAVERSFQDSAQGFRPDYDEPEDDALRQMERDSVKIGLWGSPGSGKTTFLAALRHATIDMNSQSGRWGIFPLNKLSKRLLVDFTHDMNQGNFPEATLPGVTTELKWLFIGDLAKSQFARGRKRFKLGKLESRFVLDLIDVSGSAFGYKPDEAFVPDSVVQQALQHLYGARGLIYLFDPIGERDERNSLDYVNRTVVELKEMYARAARAEPHLPHHLSVCITKFDHPDVFKEARRNGFVNFGPDGTPRVLDEHAEDFFELLCTGKFWSSRHEQGDRSARFVRNELRNAFDPRKIEYFVTSSIGFWKPPGWSGGTSDFNPDDFSNYRRAGGDRPSIRGAISPVNVLEPLIRLQQRLDGRM